VEARISCQFNGFPLERQTLTALLPRKFSREGGKRLGLSSDVQMGEIMIKQIELSKHATERAQQRGFNAEVVNFVARRGDIRKPALHGRRAIFLSDHKADLLASRGVNLGFLEIARRCLVVMAKSGVVITVHGGERTTRILG
jgi:hypothetical protein